MGNVQAQVGKRMVVGRHEVEAVQYLGEGGSSFIFLVKDVRATPTAPQLVLKRLVAHNEQTADWIASEIRLHQRLSHPQVVQFVSSQTSKARGDKSEVFILMEYCPGGHLQENMLKMGNKRFAQHELLRTFKSLCEPVAMLHSQNPPVAHRDLKLENFLLGKEGVYKLCDFGSCVEGSQSLATKADRMREADNVSKRTTAMYRSPELADVEGTAMFGSGELTEAVDVWAMGCVLYSMAFFKSPFPLEGLRTDRYTIPSNSQYSPDVHAIISRMLTADVEKRATIEHVMDCIDEIIVGRPLPPLPSASKKEKKKAKDEGEKTPSKKTEARKEAIASKTPDATDLLNMDFNPTISDSKSAAKAAAPSAFDATWSTPASTEGFADFASFPSPTSFGQSGGHDAFSTGPAKVDPFDMPSEPVKQPQAAAPCHSSVFDFAPVPAPTPTSTPVPAMASHGPVADPFDGIDGPPPSLLYGGMHQQQGQHMGQPRMGQQQMGFQQPQHGHPGGFPMQQQQQQQQFQPQQMQQQTWGAGTQQNQGYHSSNPF